MQQNSTVTGQERVLSESDHLVSRTDLQGRITYANQDFITVSGFSESELVGQPHSIVRHPDMPAEAFADMWSCLKAGRPWSGLVKNRCKNGDHYWVMANATPVFEHGQITGYMSMRTRATPEEIRDVEPAYRAFREGRAHGLALRDGQVVRTTFSPARFLAGLSIRARMFSIVAMLGLAMAVMALVGMNAMQHGEDALKGVYQDRVLPTRQLKVVADMYAVSIVDSAHKVRNGNIDAASGLRNLEDARSAIERNWSSYRAAHLTDEEKALVAQAMPLMQAADAAIVRLEAILKAKDAAALAAFTANQLYPVIDPISDKVSELIDLQIRVAGEEIEKVRSYSSSSLGVISGLLVLGVLMAMLSAWLLLRAIMRPITEVKAIVNRLAEGRLDVHIDTSRSDEMVTILDGMKTMKIKLGADMAEERRVADENLRIRQALDAVATNVRIADARGEVIYANNAMLRTLRRIEGDVRASVPGFSVDRIVGSHVSALCANPAFIRGKRAHGSGEQSELAIGAHIFDVVTTRIVSPAGEVLGMVAEWTDRTGEVGLQKEVTALVDAASRGDFVSRLEVDGKEGFFRDLSEGLNALVGQVAGSLEDVASVLNAVAGGDLSRKIERDYEGMFGQLKDDTNTTVEKLREVVGRIKEATEAINTAAREISAGNSDLSSRTEEQASSLEETASSMEELNATVRQNAESAQKANALGQSSNDEVMRGAQTVRRVVETMGEIQGSSRKIADIIGVIDSIAFQTNILALNAAVEAARAGEQGRGFAVVASEVRSLAQRSAQAAKEIKGLIADSVERVDGGAKLVEQAGETMERVVESFRQVTGLVTDIALASQEQASGIAQVTQAVSQMDGVTQQNAALVEEAAASAESLEEQARALLKVVGGFRLGQDAASAPAYTGASRVPSGEAANMPVQPRFRVSSRGVRGPTLPLPEIGEEWEEF
ncbi:methyl-accepting chemotaxis protein [Methyloversatilis thermotolerans]|uniref:methyl-accepting chemotaxis protein n=1 Tax=Methyloversatilis thermotolerans TaxID=1346290 RepID=UPI000475F603|nr:methyl-accepting chemotaxis protein [Methyloversatilis thermotolerans]